MHHPTKYLVIKSPLKQSPSNQLNLQDPQISPITAPFPTPKYNNTKQPIKTQPQA